ncbi:MAG TPA: hypothetical protein VF198_08695 [Vicinamibacterales bacterium]
MHRFLDHLLDDHYHVKRLLSHGGFGFVFEAREVVNGKEAARPLAVKIVPERKGPASPRSRSSSSPPRSSISTSSPGLSVGHGTVLVEDDQPVFYVVMDLADESLQDVVKRMNLKRRRWRQTVCRSPLTPTCL